MTTTTFKEAAHRLRDNGFVVFPADHPAQRNCIGAHQKVQCDGKRGKHPAVAFSTWNVVTPQMIDMHWDRRGGLANPAIACGPSNLVVLDDDGGLDAWAVTYGLDLPETYTVTTGRGRHLYYRWDHSVQKITNPDFPDFDMDVRGAGGLVIAEGAQHESGAIYTGNGLPVADLPDKIAQVIITRMNRGKAGKVETTWDPDDRITDPGTTQDPNTAMIGWRKRHHALVAYAGRLRSMGLDYTEALHLYRQRWELCVQPIGQIPEARFHETPPPDCNYPVTWDEAQDKLRDVYERYAAGQPEAGNEDPSAEGPEATTWEAIELGPWLSGEYTSPQPAVGISRADGRKLLYPGREHTVFGETEAGKSWFALECVAVEIRMGRDVVVIHYEESDPGARPRSCRLRSAPSTVWSSGSPASCRPTLSASVSARIRRSSVHLVGVGISTGR